MTSTALNLTEAAEFWRVARRLYSIYAELDRTFELNVPQCLELEQGIDRPEPEARAHACEWFDRIDSVVQVWQLRQLLQSTNLQSEENLRYLVARHLEKKQRNDADKEKIDFLLVQYLAHCAPHGVTEQHITLAGVAAVLEPAVGEKPQSYPDWTKRLDEKLQKMNACGSLEELQDSGALTEAREMKSAAGDHYFQPAFLVPFSPLNFPGPPRLLPGHARRSTRHSRRGKRTGAQGHRCRRWPRRRAERTRIARAHPPRRPPVEDPVSR